MDCAPSRSRFLNQNPGIFFTILRHERDTNHLLTPNLQNTLKTLLNLPYPQQCFLASQTMCPHCCLSPDIPTASASHAAQVTQH